MARLEALARLPILAAASSLTLGACRGAPPPDRLQRLLPGLGAMQLVPLSLETRPAALLRPGQSAGVRVSVPDGARLEFAVGLTDEAPPEGEVELAVSVDGKTVFSERFPPRRSHWWVRSVPLPRSGALTLAVRGDYLGAQDTGAQPWIALGSPRITSTGMARSHVLVWISVDTLRADHLGLYGYDRRTSPRLDAWARESVVFEEAIASASWTLPSLASQITSRRPSFHGATRHGLGIHDADTTLFEALSRGGFTVLGVAATPFMSARHGLARGFDAIVSTEGTADEVNRLAKRMLREAGGGDLALFIHYFDPHAPYRAPAGFVDAFARPYHGVFRGSNFDDLRTPTAEDVAHARDLYDGEILYADARIGELMDELRRGGLLDGAVVAYSADHGEEFLEHGSWRHGGTLYEEVLRVPLLLRVPGLAPRRVSAPVSLLDLAPTLLDALGVAVPASFQGRSLLSMLRGGAAAPAPAWSETELCADHRHRVALRVGSRSYVAFRDGDQLREEDAYDVAPGAGRPARPSPAEWADLRGLMLQFLPGPGASVAHPVELDPHTVERLRALGYIK